jgi:polyisoprenoid-binding protein YceI
MATPHGLMRTIHAKSMKKFRFMTLFIIVTLLTQCLVAQATPPAPELLLQLDPAKSAADITLTSTFHTVEGSFSLKHGAIRFNPVTGAARGEVVFDATSGTTGNSSRDHKMHKDVIQSGRYPEIVFHPDRAEGALATSGESTLQIHGMFAIHGAEHEVTIPVHVNLSGNAWTAKASFQVPYVKWGMKNPSVLFLRVGDTVQVQFHAAGSLAQ